ncbi:MAG: hypothetical protein NTV51_06960 [Verrucomicrobia bacterium]|nr:hypothetical protein [Verrucomicrobiota bacterium]
MNTAFPSSASAPDLLIPNLRPDARSRRTVSWAAIFAGLTAAMALQVLFMMLGAGLGFAIYTPLTDEHPIADLGKGAVVIQGVSALFSLWLGGWVAGRFTPLVVRASGALHGFIVWCAATVAAVFIVTAGAGWAMGDLSKLVGGGLSAAGRPAAALASGAADAAKDGLKKTGDTFGSFVDEALSGRPSNTREAARAKREVGAAVARLFNPMSQASPAEARSATVNALVQSGLSESDAGRMVDDWTASYERLKADLAAARQQAETKAREAADKTADALSVLSLVAFVSFLFGAASAACGGATGAKHASKRELATNVTV